MPTPQMPAIAPELRAALDSFAIERVVERHRRRTPSMEIAYRASGEPGNDSYTIEGLACVTGQEYVLAEIPGLVRVREIVAHSAFDNVLSRNPDVHLNLNHDMKYAMARTGRSASQIGGLELSMADARDGRHGLRDFARVSQEISFVRDLAVQMQSGVIDQQSFAFTIAHENRTAVDDGEMLDVLYEITEIGELYDVCICAQGANPYTDSSLRTLISTIGRGNTPGRPDDHREASASGGATPSIEPPAGADPQRARQLAAMRAKARVAIHAHQEIPK